MNGNRDFLAFPLLSLWEKARLAWVTIHARRFANPYELYSISAQDWLTRHFATTEPYEGMTAFVEKRAPRYREMRAQAVDGSPEFLFGPYQHTCPNCGTKGLPSDFKFCGNCGTSLSK